MTARRPTPATPFPDVAGRVAHAVERPSDWDERYAAAEHPWDIGAPSPPLVHALNREEVSGPGRALVPGCGFGHDVRLLAHHGFEAVGIDFSPRAVRGARARAAATATRNATFAAHDVFRLPPSMDATFDLAFEQTCFCAIHPERRDDYVNSLARALRPGGVLLGLFFVIRPEEGPPFGTTVEEIHHRFAGSGLFTVEAGRRPVESIPGRQGKEWWTRLRRGHVPAVPRAGERRRSGNATSGRAVR